MVNPTLSVNKVFREQVEKFLKNKFRPSTMSGIRNVMKKHMCVVALVIIYENRTINPIKWFMVLGCVVYYVI